jgi:hypothetical protein
VQRIALSGSFKKNQPKLILIFDISRATGAVARFGTTGTRCQLKEARFK